MNLVRQFDEFLDVAQRLGYHIRYDYFGGTGGGVCHYGGKKWLFIDLALTAEDQLDVIFSTLKSDPLFETLEIPESMRRELSKRQVA